MLQKSPEHRPSAAELLKHPQLQPCVFQVQLKSSSTRNTLPSHECLTDKVKKMTYPDDVADSTRRRMVRRNSLGSQRTVTFSKPSPERNSVISIRSIKEYTTIQSFKELSVDSSQPEDEVTSEAMITKTSTKTFTGRNQFETPKSSYTRTSHTELPSVTPLNKNAPARRVSLPLSTYETTPIKRSINVLNQLGGSPDISVNAPRIDRIAEFPLASLEDPFHTIHKLSPVQGSCSTPPSVNQSITKDKCTIHVLHVDGDNGSDSSGRGSNDSRLQRFDTTSFQQCCGGARALWPLEGVSQEDRHLAHEELQGYRPPYQHFLMVVAIFVT